LSKKTEILDFSGTHQLLVYAHVHLLVQNINIIKKTGAVLQGSKETGPEVNTEKILSTCSRFITEPEDKIIIYRWLANPLKMWRSYNICERRQKLPSQRN
jgi:hypothetical protein